MAQPRYTKTQTESDGRTRKRIVIALLTLLFLCLGTAWALGWFSGANRALTEVQQLQAKLADPSLKDQDRRVLWRELREKTDALPEEDQQAAWEAGRQRFEKRMNQRIKEVLAMSKADQQKALDADIDRIERFEKMRQERDAAQQANGQDSSKSGKNGNRQRNNGYRSDSDRITQLKNRIDRTTPEVRAMRFQYRQLLDQRIQQRGLPALPNRFG